VEVSIIGAEDLLAGRYEVGRALGAGGMGAVFAGRDRRGGAVAIKVMDPSLAGDVVDVARFTAEARALSRIRHPNVALLYDVFQHDGAVVIVLELLPGGTLADVVERGRPPLDQLMVLVTGMLAGLEAVHAAGLVHRAVKPTNVLLTADGTPKVADLGIARQIEGTRMTATGAVRGTADYLAPEQILGGVVTPRTDVYAAGALLFELLTGRPPFVGANGSLVVQQRIEAEPDWSLISDDTPPALVSVVRRALAKRADARFAGAASMSEAMNAAVRPKPASTPPPRSAAPTDSTASRHRETASTRPDAPPRDTAERGSPGVGTAVVAIGVVGLLVLLVAVGAVVGGIVPVSRSSDQTPPDLPASAVHEEPERGVPSTAIAAPSAPPSCASGASWDGSRCAALPPECPAGTVFVDDEGCLDPTVGYLSIDCEPACYYVGIPGRPLGKSPLVRVPLPPGKQAIFLNAFSDRRGAPCEMKTVTVAIQAGQVTTKKITMCQ
jgi:serine/threonine protein kinase